MPQVFPDASDYLRFKKLQIIQDSNNSSNRKNKINKQREYDADSMIVNIPRTPFNYQMKMPLPSCSGRFEYNNGRATAYIITNGKFVTQTYSNGHLNTGLSLEYISLRHGQNIQETYPTDYFICLVNCTKTPLTVTTISQIINPDKTPGLEHKAMTYTVPPNGFIHPDTHAGRDHYMKVTIHVA